MSKFNFDSCFFRRVISKCKKTEKVTSLSRMTQEAVEVFFDEFDYYPEISVFAPGTFTIMGDHLEYVKGNLVQAALPLGAVIVGKSLCSLKCKVITTSRNVHGLRRSVFPISHYKKNLKVFPDWVNYIKGVINFFPDQDIRGFDVVIHSSVPFSQGYASSAALQVGFYTFLEAVVGQKTCKRKNEKGRLCALSESELELCQNKLGRWSNLTSSVAEANTCVKVNCRTEEVSTFEIRDINIVFLLTRPKFEIERKDRDLVCWRKMELFVAAKLLGLNEIIDATEHHLSVLENMEDPTKDTVRDILREMGKTEECIEEFVEDLFYFPTEFYGEDYYYPVKDFTKSEECIGEAGEAKSEHNWEPCGVRNSQPKWLPKPKPVPVSYIHERLAELCAGKTNSNTDFPKRVCEEINCLGGIDNLSTMSEMSVCGKLLRRVRHIVTENIRSLTLSELISQLDYEELGTKLIQSHLSLKIDYDVSCPTLDGLVQLAIDADRVYGAKMTSGGGTLTLLHRSVVEDFIEKIIEKFGDDFQFYLVFPSSGAMMLNMGVKKNPMSSLSDPFLNRDELLKKAVENFEATYKYRPTHGAFSPGVLNLIGDHTDYNHGFCISLASNMLTVVVGAINGTSKIRVVTTANVGSETPRVIFSVPEFEPIRPGNIKWARLVKSVVAHYKGNFKGFDCLIQSALPCSSGISSKVALVLSLYTFIEVIGGEKPISTAEKAFQCMMAVQDFNKTVCGVSDFLVAERSKEDFVVVVDSWSSATTLIPFQDPSVTLLLTIVDVANKCNRALLYVRMEECYDVAKALGAKSLRCLTLEDLNGGRIDFIPNMEFSNSHSTEPELYQRVLNIQRSKIQLIKEEDQWLLLCNRGKLPESSIRRAVHVVTENERVLKAAEALKNNDFDVLGELMVASHNSLRDNYEITTPELDNLVVSAMEVDGVFGSKMPCNGCVSSTLTLVKRWATDDLIEYLQKSTSQKLTFYVVNPYECCNKLNVKEFVDKLPSPQFVFENIFPF